MNGGTAALREELHAAALQIEMETRGFLPASGYSKLIDKAILPEAGAEDLVEQFLPIVVLLDSGGALTGVEDAAKTATGAVGLFSDRAVLGWMSGFVRLKFGSHTVPYDEVSSASARVFEETGWRGVDVVARSDWSLLFGEGLDPHLTMAWANELAARLSGSWDDGDGGTRG